MDIEEDKVWEWNELCEVVKSFGKNPVPFKSLIINPPPDLQWIKDDSDDPPTSTLMKLVNVTHITFVGVYIQSVIAKDRLTFLKFIYKLVKLVDISDKYRMNFKLQNERNEIKMVKDEMKRQIAALLQDKKYVWTSQADMVFMLELLKEKYNVFGDSVLGEFAEFVVTQKASSKLHKHLVARETLTQRKVPLTSKTQLLVSPCHAREPQDVNFISLKDFYLGIVSSISHLVLEDEVDKIKAMFSGKDDPIILEDKSTDDAVMEDVGQRRGRSKTRGGNSRNNSKSNRKPVESDSDYTDSGDSSNSSSDESDDSNSRTGRSRSRRRSKSRNGRSKSTGNSRARSKSRKRGTSVASDNWKRVEKEHRRARSLTRGRLNNVARAPSPEDEDESPLIDNRRSASGTVTNNSNNNNNTTTGPSNRPSTATGPTTRTRSRSVPPASRPTDKSTNSTTNSGRSRSKSRGPNSNSTSTTTTSTRRSTSRRSNNTDDNNSSDNNNDPPASTTARGKRTRSVSRGRTTTASSNKRSNFGEPEVIAVLDIPSEATSSPVAATPSGPAAVNISGDSIGSRALTVIANSPPSIPMAGEDNAENPELDLNEPYFDPAPAAEALPGIKPEVKQESEQTTASAADQTVQPESHIAAPTQAIQPNQQRVVSDVPMEPELAPFYATQLVKEEVEVKEEVKQEVE